MHRACLKKPSASREAVAAYLRSWLLEIRERHLQGTPISRSAVASRDGSTSRGSFSGCTATYLKKRAQLLEKREQLPEKRPPRDTRAGFLEERHLEKRARILRKGGVSQDAQDAS